MHLHGHDFWVLDAGYGSFNIGRTESLALVNTPREMSPFCRRVGI